jgi:beta-glucosidase
VEEAAIDRKVLRLLRLAARVGALDGVAPAVEATGAQAWDEREVAAELRATAAAGFVLARNESGLLPLDPAGLTRVAVLGPNAAQARTLGGGSATVFPPYTVSPLDGLRDALGAGVDVTHAPGVRTHERLPAASAALLGGEGTHVRFLDAADELLGEEDRPAAAYAWLGSYGPGVPADRVAAIEVRARLRPERSGPHVLGASGLGRFRLWVDGTELFDERLALRAGADPAEAHMRPPQHGVAAELEAGREVEVLLRHDLEEGGHGTSFELSGATFQLNVDPPHSPDDEELARAAELAAAADVAVLVVGTTEEVESEGFDRDSLDLPGRQDELVRRVVAANPRTVVVVNAGAPVLLPWSDEVPAVLLAWFPGQEFGHALADVLLGRAEPGGRLPTTWPASAEGLPSTQPQDGVLAYEEGLLVGHRAGEPGGRAPRYPFGHGLGYASWEYLGLEVQDAGSDDARVRVRVRVRNTGGRHGGEVVQVYASRPGSGVPRPVRWLAGFARVEAGPGEEVDAHVEVAWRSLAHWDPAAGAFAVEAGTFALQAGRSADDLRVSGALEAGPG